MELVTGDAAPQIAAAASSGKTVKLRDFTGKWVILYFYPRDETPGCTREACNFRDCEPKLTGLNGIIIGCSPDDLKTHDKFITKYDLPFILLSDPDHAVCSAFGVWKEKNMYGRKIMSVQRSTFLIDPAGLIRKIWRRVKVDGHADELIDELKMLAR